MTCSNRLSASSELADRVGKALGLDRITDVKISVALESVSTVNVTVLLTEEQMEIILGKEV